MASYLRPRRGKSATATSQLTTAAPLKNGEVFFETETIGSTRGNIMMGNGSSAYSGLTYFLVNEDKAMTFSSVSSITGSSSTADSTLLGSIKSTANTAGIFKDAMNAIKQLLWNHSAQITKLNNDKWTKPSSAVGNYRSPIYYVGAGTFSECNVDLDGSKFDDLSYWLSTDDAVKAWTEKEFQGFIKGNWLVHYLGRRVVSSGTNQYSYIFTYQQNVGVVAVNNSHGGCYYGDKTISLPATVSDIKATVNVMPNAYVIWGYISGQSTTQLTIRAVGGMSSTNATLTITILAYAVTSTKITA